MILNTFSRNKRRQNCEEPKWIWRFKVPLFEFSVAIQCLGAKIIGS